VEEGLQDKIASLTAELEKLNPNMRAIERLESVEARLKSTEKDFEDSRNAAKAARDAFNAVKAQRFELFNKAFTHIKEQISHVYKDLTRSDAYPLGGTAYLDVEEDTDTPYLSGIKYHAMPPLKRFREMDLLSGGEKTMAALALLFAIHSYQPSPFFVLDEVDAALDNANVGMVKKYIREHAGPGMQFIVISLKPTLFQDSESLVGVYRDQDVNSSRTLTLDVSQSDCISVDMKTNLIHSSGNTREHRGVLDFRRPGMAGNGVKDGCVGGLGVSYLRPTSRCMISGLLFSLYVMTPVWAMDVSLGKISIASQFITESMFTKLFRRNWPRPVMLTWARGSTIKMDHSRTEMGRQLGDPSNALLHPLASYRNVRDAE
jgi:RecF/RecN/SMC N terminal domain